MKNKIYNEDCLDGMQRIDDNSIDCIICDLPYGTTTLKWDVEIRFDLLWAQYNRILKQNGVVVLFGIEPFTAKLINSNINKFKEKLIWQKHKPSNIGCAKYMHLKYHEDIIVFANKKHTFNPQLQPRLSSRIRDAQKGKSKQWRTTNKTTGDVSFSSEYAPREWTTFNADYKYPSSIINIPAVVSNSIEKTNHPTQKPIKLLEYLIKTYSNENDLILDNCTGSGTTAIAAHNTGRNFIGFEIDKEYYDLSMARLDKILKTPKQQKIAI